MAESSKSGRRQRVPRVVRRNRFLFHLVYEPVFLGAVVVFLILALLAPVFLLKIWIVSPKGFEPVIKVRALDFFQASALRRSANRATQSGDFKEAMQSWRGAVENNPANPSDLRRALDTVVRLKPPAREWLGWSLYYGNWLLRLEQTNIADVALFSQVLDHYLLDDAVVQLLEPHAASLTPAQAAPLLRCLFHLGRTDAFAREWDRHKQAFAAMPELRLYDVAYTAGWGTSLQAAEAQKQLDAAAIDPASRPTANRLLLSVAVARNRIDLYQSALTRLEEDHVDRIPDHVRHWLLLALNKRTDEARALTRKFVKPPESASDAEIMARGLVRLGLRDEALTFVASHQEAFDYNPALWTLHSQLLLETGRWVDLQTLAVAMRQRDRLAVYLGGYSYYLEGLAEFQQGRTALADRAFQELAAKPIPDPVLAYSSATQLRKLGRPELAAKIFGQLESSYSNHLEFWLQLQSSAFDARDFDLLLAATKRAYEIAPGRLEYMNNYAAALLVSRQRPAEAVDLTFRALNLAPRAFETRLNHALALLQLGRLADAEPLLKELSTEPLDSEHDNLVHLGWFEFYLASADTEKARLHAARVDPRRLLPPQSQWFESKRTNLVSRTANP